MIAQTRITLQCVVGAGRWGAGTLPPLQKAGHGNKGNFFPWALVALLSCVYVHYSHAFLVNVYPWMRICNKKLIHYALSHFDCSANIYSYIYKGICCICMILLEDKRKLHLNHLVQMLRNLSLLLLYVNFH